MMMRQLVGMVAALGLTFAGSSAARAIGRFDIKPISVNFVPGASSASVEFTNAGETSQELEISVKAWNHSDGGDEGDPTDDIVASPSIFLIAPGQTQLVRLGLAAELTGDVERTYRLVATEVPPPAAGGTVQTILRMRLPVFVAPHHVDALPLAWRVGRRDPAQLIVAADNGGNVHKRVRALRVMAGGRVLFDQVVAAYVFAHGSVQWPVRLEAGSAAATISVHATEIDGATQDASFSVR